MLPTATKYSNILIDSNKTCCCSGTEYYRSRGRMIFFIKDLFLLGYFLLIWFLKLIYLLLIVLYMVYSILDHTPVRIRGNSDYTAGSGLGWRPSTRSGWRGRSWTTWPGRNSISLSKLFFQEIQKSFELPRKINILAIQYNLVPAALLGKLLMYSSECIKEFVTV